MPKLSKTKQKSVAKAESTGFKALEAGMYIGTLKQVVTQKGGKPLEGPAGPYWQWEFDQITDLAEEETFPGRQFVITSLSDDSDWKMKETYEAMGYSLDSDTDEMVGDRVILSVSQRPIEKGPRKGQIGNQVDRLHHIDDLAELLGEEPEVADE
jgi:hypothetical protein